jgi:hypothetical protein
MSWSFVEVHDVEYLPEPNFGRVRVCGSGSNSYLNILSAL